MISLINKLLGNAVINIVKSGNEVFVLVAPKNITFTLKLLKNHTSSLFNQLLDISTVDYPERSNRFEVIYHLISVKYSSRINIRTYTDEINPIESAISVFPSANWPEREAWDMMGIFFSNHTDLRRILTDYGFNGYPLRKDFPLSGYLEVRYDDSDKHIRYEPLELAQEFRNYDYLTPWINPDKISKDIKNG